MNAGGPPLRVLAAGNAYPPHLLGGYEIVWQGVTHELQRAGHDVRVLTTDHRRPGAADAPQERAVRRELRWYWRDHAWPRLGPRAVLALERHNAAVLDRHIDEFAPDVVTWWPMGGMSLSMIERVRRRGLPAILFVHDYWPDYGPQVDRWARAFKRRPWLASPLERLTGVPARLDLAGAGRWLFNSETVQAHCAAIGMRPADAAVLSPGVARDLIEASREPVPPAWAWRILYIGRVVEQKGVDVAVTALAGLPGEATLRIVGDGDERYLRRLRALAESLGVAERVVFEPSRERCAVAAVYRDADVVVFPVRWEEPWGLVPLEAMALARPVVATGRGGSADYLRDGSNALLFRADDAVALGAAITRLAGDAALRARLGQAGIATAAAHGEDRFNAAAVAEIEHAALRHGAGRPADRAALRHGAGRPAAGKRR